MARIGGAPAIVLALSLLAGAVEGRQAQRSVWDGVYTTAQAERGQVAYSQSCAGCHADDLRGKGTAPSLVEESFAFQWSDLSLGDLFAKMLLMPSDRPGSLPRQSYVDLMAFLLQKNAIPTGPQELGGDPAALKQIFITAKPAAAR